MAKKQTTLTIHRSIWGNEMYAMLKGERKNFDNYESARELAEKNGFSGIQIDYKDGKRITRKK